MRLYAVTLSAVRDKGGEKPEVSFSNSFALLHDHEDIEAEALARAREVFPETDGYSDYLVTHTEIESGVVFADRYRLTWSVEDGQEQADSPQGSADRREGAEAGDR